jgi:hypothetical protein
LSGALVADCSYNGVRPNGSLITPVDLTMIVQDARYVDGIDTGPEEDEIPWE